MAQFNIYSYNSPHHIHFRKSLQTSKAMYHLDSERKQKQQQQQQQGCQLQLQQKAKTTVTAY